VALDRFLSDHFVFLQILSSHHCSKLVVVFVKVTLLSEGRTGQCSALSGIKEHKQKNSLTIFGEEFQNINGVIMCSFTNSASTTDVTPVAAGCINV